DATLVAPEFLRRSSAALLLEAGLVGEESGRLRIQLAETAHLRNRLDIDEQQFAQVADGVGAHALGLRLCGLCGKADAMDYRTKRASGPCRPSRPRENIRRDHARIGHQDNHSMSTPFTFMSGTVVKLASS